MKGSVIMKCTGAILASAFICALATAGHAQSDRSQSSSKAPASKSTSNPCPRGQAVVLRPPFERHEGNAYLKMLPEHADIADSNEHPERSKLVLCEGNRALGPAHSQHVEIIDQGRGRFSHFGAGLLFATADNSDPNTNRREYKIVLPNRTADRRP
jgi:hypothetical protein